MKKIVVALAGLGIATAAVPASAQAWQNINARQAQLDQRINQGIRAGSLTRPEAVRLRGEFRQLAQLEQRYRAGGLNLRERRDLDRRFDVLASKIRIQKNDWQDRRGRR